MDRTEWLKQRRKGIGGSDVLAVLGQNKYKSRYQLYLEKTGDGPIAIPDSSLLAEVGIVLEEPIAKWWVRQSHYKVQADNKIRFHSKFPFLIANIDRLITKPIVFDLDIVRQAEEANKLAIEEGRFEDLRKIPTPWATPEDRGTGILEIKTTSAWGFGKWEEYEISGEDGDGILPPYYPQLQHYFNITGHKWGSVAVFIRDSGAYHTAIVEPDKDYMQYIQEECVKFWMDHVERRIAPEIETEEDIKLAYPKSTENEVMEATRETVHLFEQTVRQEKEVELHTQKLDALKTNLKATMRTAEILRYEGTVLATFKSTKESARFDKEAFAAKHPDIYDQFVIMTPGYRRFLLKKNAVVNGSKEMFSEKGE